MNSFLCIQIPLQITVQLVQGIFRKFGIIYLTMVICIMRYRARMYMRFTIFTGQL